MAEATSYVSFFLTSDEKFACMSLYCVFSVVYLSSEAGFLVRKIFSSIVHFKDMFCEDQLPSILHCLNIAREGQGSLEQFPQTLLGPVE